MAPDEHAPPDEPGEQSAAADRTQRPARAVVRRPPWYRRGNVWVGIVAVTAIGAWVISDLAEERIGQYDSDPTSAEVLAWCDVTAGAAGFGLFDPSDGPDPGDALGDWVVRGSDAHDELAAAAPGEIHGDAAAAAAAYQDLITDERFADAPDEVDEASAAELVEVVRGVQAEHEAALGRVDDFTRSMCGHGVVAWPIVVELGPPPTDR